MNQSSPVFKIYPSQLKQFKEIARQISLIIENITNSKQLSAFKRNDYLAVSLGYKGYPDLIQSTKFRSSTDKKEQLKIFTDNNILHSIIDVFCLHTEAKKIDLHGELTRLGEIFDTKFGWNIENETFNHLENIKNPTIAQYREHLHVIAHMCETEEYKGEEGYDMLGFSDYPTQAIFALSRDDVYFVYATAISIKNGKVVIFGDLEKKNLYVDEEKCFLTMPEILTFLNEIPSKFDNDIMHTELTVYADSSYAESSGIARTLMGWNHESMLEAEDKKNKRVSYTHKGIVTKLWNVHSNWECNEDTILSTDDDIFIPSI
jgi:hypothetical protein